MEQSILTSTKKNLGIDVSYTAFDLDILTHINTAFATLYQLGIGPDVGFSIVDATTEWSAFIGTDPKYNAVKTYVYLKVRQYFDPPQTSYLVEATKEQIRELEWRLNVLFEMTGWVAPVDDEEEELPLVIDGGEA